MLEDQPFELAKLHFPSLHGEQGLLLPLTASSKNHKVYEGLAGGRLYCVEGTWGTAMAFYSWLKKQANIKYPVYDYQSSRVNRDQLKSLTQNLLVRVANNKIDLTNAPLVPWLKEFYPNLSEFYLPFAEVLGMNGAWQWYTKGIQFPNLNHKVHPFYGVYFPTRHEHLELFNEWLLRNEPIRSAIDIGTGCGILTFYMIKNGVKKVLATDINQNAIYSLSIELNRLDIVEKVELQRTNFLEEVDAKDFEAIVFNPPWIPETPSNALDMAMYYQSNFFDNFFTQAYGKLKSGTTVLLLFSTFAQVAGVASEHPIEQELAANKRFALVSKTENPILQNPSSKKHWLTEIRSKERAELWELVRV